MEYSGNPPSKLGVLKTLNNSFKIEEDKTATYAIEPCISIEAK